MRYLLDTCVISDFIKGEPGTTARLKQTPPADTALVRTEQRLLVSGQGYLPPHNFTVMPTTHYSIEPEPYQGGYF